jgi:uncharacterized phage infection (PIP) family protein YhgE
MPLRLLGSGATTAPSAALTALQAEVERVRAATQAAHDLAEKAEGTGQNARSMVLSRDTKLNTAAAEAAQAVTSVTTLAQQQATLEALAATLGSAIPASEATHAAINKRIDDLATLLAAHPSTLAFGMRPVGALLLGAGTTVTLPLSRPMPADTYRIEVVHSAVVNLSNVTLAVTTKTQTSVTVRVTATGLALAAGTLMVGCW